MIMDKRTAWAVLWTSKNKLDGLRQYLIHEKGFVKLFRTRHEARLWIREHFGYIRQCPDLRAEPHGWKTPIPVRVAIEIQVLP